MAFVRRTAVVLGVLCLAGCGGSGGTAKRRDAVDAYFGRVNRAESTLLSSEGQIDRAFQRFSVAKTTPSELHSLVRARATVRSARLRVGAIEPPADARRLHADLLRLLGLQESVADELVRSAQFIPRFAAIAPPLAGAATQLGRDLAGVKPPAPATASGAQLWTAGGCGGCHTLAASGSNGTSGPNLDDLTPSKAAVVAAVRDGSPKMPSYRKALTTAQIDAVASYVASAAGRPAAGSAGPGVAQKPATQDVFAEYAAAFARYRVTIEPVRRKVDRLTAPPELRPGLLAERRALDRSISLCTEIEAALAKHDVAAANKSIQALFGLASGINSAEVARQQAAAAHAYNARLATITKLSVALNSERLRLQKELG